MCPAPPGNTNGLKHGGRSRRLRAHLTIGHLGKSFRRAVDNAQEYRRHLEEQTFAVHGEIGTVRAHLIDAACGLELHGGVCRWIMRKKLNDMSPTDVANVSAQLARSRVERNRTVIALKLDQTDQSLWDTLEAAPVALQAPPDPEEDE